VPYKKISPYFSLIVKLDDQYVVNERYVMTIIDALSATGGILSLCLLLFRLVISGARKQAFYSKLINRFFAYEDEYVVTSAEKT
jgi:hypothetical protein